MNKVKLQPGDYVSTEGVTEEQYHAVCEAFMEAGAEKGEYSNLDYRVGDCLGWNSSIGIFHGHDFSHPSWGIRFKRKLTIDQILGKEQDMDNKDMSGNAAESSVSLAEAYKVMQANCGIEVGDTVKVLRKAGNGENGWGAVWNKIMDFTIGNEGIVKDVRGTRGLRIHLGGDEQDWLYPFFVLELVKKALKLPAPIRISSEYKIIFREDGGIDVGCQTLDFDMIEKIYMAAKEVKGNCDG